jgi:Flp pilus assembly protein TadG
MGVEGLVRRALRARKPGQSLVEFAIILPVFMLLTFGVIDFGYMLFRQLETGNCARDVARKLAVQDENWAATIPASCQTGTDGVSYGTVYKTSAGASATGPVPGGSVTVNATRTHEWFVVNVFIPGMPSSRQMAASATMRVEAGT